MALKSTKVTVNVRDFTGKLVEAFEEYKVKEHDWVGQSKLKRNFIETLRACDIFSPLTYEQIARQFDSYVSREKTKLEHGLRLYELTQKLADKDNDFTKIVAPNIISDALQLFENNDAPCLPKHLFEFMKRYF